MTTDALIILLVFAFVAGAVYGGGYILDRKNTALPEREPIEHFDGEP